MTLAHQSPASPLAAYSGEQLDVLRESVIGGKATNAHLIHYVQVARHLDLDPFAGEVAGVLYGTTLSVQVTVEGLLTLAERTGVFAGADGPYWCGQDGAWRDVWLASELPLAAKAIVYRTDRPRPSVGVVLMAEQKKMGGTVWNNAPVHMLGVAALRLALRRSGQRELSRLGIETRELSLPSRISMEARQVGMGDDERHALVAEVTGGRTESTRELEPEEALVVRERIAERKAPPPGVDPQTGVLDRSVVEQIIAEDAEEKATQWVRDDAYQNVRPSLLAIAEGTQRTRNHWAATLNRMGLAQEAVAWSVADLERVARLLKSEKLWVEPKPLPAATGDADWVGTPSDHAQQVFDVEMARRFPRDERGKPVPIKPNPVRRVSASRARYDYGDEPF